MVLTVGDLNIWGVSRSSSRGWRWVLWRRSSRRGGKRMFRTKRKHRDHMLVCTFGWKKRLNVLDTVLDDFHDSCFSFFLFEAETPVAYGSGWWVKMALSRTWSPSWIWTQMATTRSRKMWLAPHLVPPSEPDFFSGFHPWSISGVWYPFVQAWSRQSTTEHRFLGAFHLGSFSLGSEGSKDGPKMTIQDLDFVLGPFKTDLGQKAEKIAVNKSEAWMWWAWWTIATCSLGRKEICSLVFGGRKGRSKNDVA